jgi:hypothetical protein
MRSTATLLATLAEQPASGEWHRIDSDSVRGVGSLLEKVLGFGSLDHPAGDHATRFLQTEAIQPGASVVTRAVVGPERIEGFVSTNFTDVELTRADAKSIGVKHRSRLPAFRLAWIARHRESPVKGLELFAGALGMAMEAAEHGGLVAMLIEPADPVVADIWRREPYLFQETDSAPNNKGLRPLWLPLGL